MHLRKLIIHITLRICCIFLIFKKVDQNKITFISLESDILSGDFKLLSNVLEKENTYHLNYVLVKFEKSLKGNIDYFMSCVKQLFEVNTSALVILDYNNYVVSHFKRKKVNVLQLWHATGAIKKFGNDVNRDYTISNYDYVIVNSEYFIRPFASAFGVDEKQVRVTGIPKTDRLFNKKKIEKDKQSMLSMFPQINGKKVVLYAPTFRGKLMHQLNASSIDLTYIKQSLGENYIVLYKMHPLLSNQIIVDDPDIICCNNMSIKKLFSVSDYLISDYSAIIIDFAIFNKPMLFYVPDLEEYRKDVGLYVEYEKEMPGPICKNEKQIVQHLQEDKFDMQKIKIFTDTSFHYQDGKSTNRVVKLIHEIMEESK